MYQARLTADGVSTEQLQGAEQDAGCIWIARDDRLSQKQCLLTDVFICVMIINPGIPFCLDHHIEEAMRSQLLHMQNPHFISHIHCMHQVAMQIMLYYDVMREGSSRRYIMQSCNCHAR